MNSSLDLLSGRDSGVSDGRDGREAATQLTQSIRHSSVFRSRKDSMIDAFDSHLVPAVAADSIWNVRLTKCSRVSGNCNVGRNGSRGRPRHAFSKETYNCERDVLVAMFDAL